MRAVASHSSHPRDCKFCKPWVVEVRPRSVENKAVCLCVCGRRIAASVVTHGWRRRRWRRGPTVSSPWQGSGDKIVEIDLSLLVIRLCERAFRLLSSSSDKEDAKQICVIGSSIAEEVCASCCCCCWTPRWWTNTSAIDASFCRRAWSAFQGKEVLQFVVSCEEGHSSSLAEDEILCRV